MTLYIKNMVCNRCIKAVERILNQQDIYPENIQLGQVTLSGPLSEAEKEIFTAALRKEGFELLDDKKSRLISEIKNRLIQFIHYENRAEHSNENISQYLSAHLHKDYNYLSNVFSESESVTIEQFVIHQKIEKVKELLIYDELSLNEIAYQLGYSSTAHLSAQFKKVTGFTPTKFKKLKQHRRKPLDEI